MSKFGSYLVCKKYIEEVREFLLMFFEEEHGRYNHSGWGTFKVPGTDFSVNIMSGDDQKLTQNMTFEIDCNSKKELEDFAKKYNCEIYDFLATEAAKRYRYYYIEVLGPQNICKMEISYSEYEE